jgi:long-chain acyl-CoA synthetase
MSRPELLTSIVRDALDGREREVYRERNGDGWRTTGTGELRSRVDGLARALAARGIAPGDRVALMAGNAIDWIVADFAILGVGGVVVPIYSTQAPDHVAHILQDSGAKLLFVESVKLRERLAITIALPPTIAFDDPGPYGMKACETAGAAMIEPADVVSLTGGLAPDDLAVLIYTSGTTGTPKGVMLTHRNIASNAMSSFSLVAEVMLPEDPILSILPFAHIYEHTNLFGYLIRGCTVSVSRSTEQILDDLRAVRPAWVFAVPRIFEKILASIVTRARAKGGLQAKLVPWAVMVAREYGRAISAGGQVPPTVRLAHAVAHVLVLKKLRPVLGLDRLKFFISGSAKLHPDTAFAFLGADILIDEGYGLTECSPVVTCNAPGQKKIGTVGRPIPGVEVTLADDGELLVRGPNVMRGYYHNADATEEALHYGWLATGDIAEIDADGFVAIVDRKKELFKTSGGKFIAPARVESALMRSPYISQAVVVGNGRAHPAALVAPNWVALKTVLTVDDDRVAAANDAAVHEFFTKEVVAQTADLAGFEQIRMVGILPRDLTIEGEELTPTFKVRRRVVERKYEASIDAIYTATERGPAGARALRASP